MSEGLGKAGIESREGAEIEILTEVGTESRATLDEEGAGLEFVLVAGSQESSCFSRSISEGFPTNFVASIFLGFGFFGDKDIEEVEDVVEVEDEEGSKRVEGGEHTVCECCREEDKAGGFTIRLDPIIKPLSRSKSFFRDNSTSEVAFIEAENGEIEFAFG
jgi:hypothetical protein